MKVEVKSVPSRVKTLSQKALRIKKHKNFEKQVSKPVNTNYILETLERQAEMMSPQEYINARTYLSELERMRFMQDGSIF